jgi:hypothetical protein
VTRVYDHKGVELLPTILQIKERNEQGAPVLLRVRFDDEKVGFVDPNERTFLIVWAPVGAQHEFPASDLARQFHEAKLLSEQLHTEVVETRRMIDQVQREHKALTEENEKKTAALRELQRERDPERLAGLIDSAVRIAGDKAAKEITELRATLATKDSEITELRASKRKLREALDRLKEERGKGK